MQKCDIAKQIGLRGSSLQMLTTMVNEKKVPEIGSTKEHFELQAELP